MFADCAGNEREVEVVVFVGWCIGRELVRGGCVLLRTRPINGPRVYRNYYYIARSSKFVGLM